MTPSQPTAHDCPRQDPCRRSRQDQAQAYADFHDPFRPPCSQRDYAQQHSIPRSTLGDWLRQDDPPGVEPEVTAFFRSPPGQRFLRGLVLALHLVFRHLCPCGIRPLCLFLRLCGLDRFVGASYGAQHSLDQDLQRLIPQFADQQQPPLAAAMKQRCLDSLGEPFRQVVACLDEHFHADDPCLVGVEPVSNFILLEAYCPRRDADTWTQQLQQATAGLPVRLVALTSDEASGLLRCAREGLGVPHCPDLFHQQRLLSGPVLGPLGRGIAQAHKELEQAQQHTQRLDQAHDASIPPERRGQVIDLAFVEPLCEAIQAEAGAERDLEQARQWHEQAVGAVRALGDAYHPYDRATGKPLSAEQVGEKLRQAVGRLEGVVEQAGLGHKAQEAAAKGATVAAALGGCVAWFFGQQKRRVEALELPEEAEALVNQRLLPGLYWQAQGPRQREAQERQRLAEMSAGLLEQAWQPGGALGVLGPEERGRVEAVARECVGWFSRSSSCVEGRNGRLGLYQHGQTRLSQQRLAVLRVVHNYVARREDGTTAAERFFGQKHPDAFEWLLARMPELPRPAARRPSKAASTPSLHQ
jgi:hypothetical protein